MADAEILDFLREQFNRVNARLDAVERRLIEVEHRLGNVERQIIGIRRDAASDAEAAYAVRSSVDALAERVSRIERRLDLVP